MNQPLQRYRRVQGVLHAEVDGEEVLLNPETGVYHLVNRTGRTLLILMEKGDSLDEAVRAVAEGSKVDPDKVRQDALAFVAAMSDRGLLEVVDD